MGFVFHLATKTWKVFKRLQRSRLLGLSAEVAFYEMLAFFPFLLICLTLIKYLPASGLIQTGLSMLRAVSPPIAVNLMESWINQARHSANLSLISFGAIISLWVGSSGIASFQRAFLIIHGGELKKSLGRRIGIRLALTVMGAVALVMLLLFWVVWPLALQQMRKIGWYEDMAASWIEALARDAMGVTVLVVGLTSFYHALTPTHGTLKSRLPGACLATLLFLILSTGMSWYFRHVGTFQSIYGSLASLMVLMVWLQSINISILMGEAWNAEPHWGE